MSIQILTGVVLPPQVRVGAGRKESEESKALRSMTEGQSFVLTLASERKAKSKQSHIGGIAKKIGIFASTRLYAEIDENGRETGNWKLGVWHMGPRDEDDEDEE